MFYSEANDTGDVNLFANVPSGQILVTKMQ